MIVDFIKCLRHLNHLWPSLPSLLDWVQIQLLSPVESSSGIRSTIDCLDDKDGLEETYQLRRLARHCSRFVPHSVKASKSRRKLYLAIFELLYSLLKYHYHTEESVAFCFDFVSYHLVWSAEFDNTSNWRWACVALHNTMYKSSAHNMCNMILLDIQIPHIYSRLNSPKWCG